LNSINDLGVIFDSNLTFKDHMAQKINKAYSVLGIIKRLKGAIPHRGVYEGCSALLLGC